MQAQLPCGRVAAQQRGTHRRTPCGCNVTHYQFQNLGYRYDNVGNILGIANNSLYPKGQQGISEEVGGPVTQSYIYDDLYRLKEASGEYRHEADELRRYRMGMDYDSIHNIVAKEQLDEEVEKENGKTETEVEHETSYTYAYHYAAPQTGSNTGSIHPHAPSEIGHYSFQYDRSITVLVPIRGGRKTFLIMGLSQGFLRFNWYRSMTWLKKALRRAHQVYRVP